MKYFILLSVLLVQTPAYSSCIKSAEANHDLLKTLLESAKTCPDDIQGLKELIKDDALERLPALVANRGRNNPDLGSFSLFESVKGHSTGLQKDILPEHFYFGHFTDLENGTVILDQKPAPGKLLIEVMAWDFSKGMYNFYELVGTESGTGWFYRGDSNDALLDNKNLKITSQGDFGQRMRCSGCHVTGEPIMKEISFPYNDWWRDSRKLAFGKNTLSSALKQYVDTFIDASEFSLNVRNGMKLLSKGHLAPPSVKEKLRPLFCSTEINLYSDDNGFVEPASDINVPSVIFIDPLLVKNKKLKLPKRYYLSALRKLKFRFPETTFSDADHGFLAPGRSESHFNEVRKLISTGMIDEEFALDILNVDFKSPLFSAQRCNLLKLIPESSNWKNGLIENLKKMSSPEAYELLKNLSVTNKDEHKKKAEEYLEEKEKSWISEEEVVSEVKKLDALRGSVFKDELSKNPRGQILEPGFRVIFPVKS